jgi:hypothetical protein
MASMTIEAIERFLARDNKSMFAAITFPTGIDKDIAVNEILRASSPFEVLYADGDYLIEAVKLWADKYYYTFAKWQKGFAEDFSPIDNYDKHSEITTNEGSEDKTTYGKKTTETHDVSAYDSSGYSPEDKVVTDLSNSDTVTYKKNFKHTEYTHGNIGVSTSTDVLQKWMSFYSDHNIYQMISDCFITEFCIMVY